MKPEYETLARRVLELLSIEVFPSIDGWRYANAAVSLAHTHGPFATERDAILAALRLPQC